MSCENCNKFESYEHPHTKVPDNCVAFLCNDGECPNYNDIHKTQIGEINDCSIND